MDNQEFLYIRLLDRSTVFQETEQRVTIVGEQIGKVRNSQRVSDAINGGVIVEVTNEEVELYRKEVVEPERKRAIEEKELTENRAAIQELEEEMKRKRALEASRSILKNLKKISKEGTEDTFEIEKVIKKNLHLLTLTDPPIINGDGVYSLGHGKFGSIVAFVDVLKLRHSYTRKKIVLALKNCIEDLNLPEDARTLDNSNSKAYIDFKEQLSTHAITKGN